MKTNTLKRVKLPLISTIVNLGSAITLFLFTASVNLQLFGIWFDRAYHGWSPEAQAALEALRASSLYATFLTDCHILVTALILLVELALFGGLLWLAWQNFGRTMWILLNSRKK